MRILPIVTIAMLALDCGHAAHANGGWSPLPVSGTIPNRTINAPTYSSSGGGSGSSSGGGSSGSTSSTPWPKLEGCDTPGATDPQGNAIGNGTVYESLSNASNYSYSQTYANDMSTVQAPQSYSSCLGGLFKEFQQISDMFTSGFSIAGAITGFASSAVNNLVDGLENQVCKTVTSAANGIFGSFKINFSALGISSVISIDPATATITGTVALPTTPTPVYTMPVQTPAPAVGASSSSSSGGASSSSGSFSSSGFTPVKPPWESSSSSSSGTYCDPSDPNGGCYCNQNDPNSSCYYCDQNDPNSGCYNGWGGGYNPN